MVDARVSAAACRPKLKANFMQTLWLSQSLVGVHEPKCSGLQLIRGNEQRQTETIKTQQEWKNPNGKTFPACCCWNLVSHPLVPEKVGYILAQVTPTIRADQPLIAADTSLTGQRAPSLRLSHIWCQIR